MTLKQHLPSNTRLFSGAPTGRRMNYYGTVLPEVSAPGAGAHDLVQVGEDWFYCHDFGGVWALSRQAHGEDAGGNVHRGPRTAPASLQGISAPRPGLLLQTGYSEPVYWLK